MARLKPRHANFVREYLIDLNATQAAIRAGYGAKNAKVSASRLLTRADVLAELGKVQSKREHRTEITGDRVLSELFRIAMSDVGAAFDENGRLKPLKDIPIDIRRAISSIEVEELFEGSGEERTQSGYVRKIKLWDKVKSLEHLAKHLGLLRDKLEVTGKDGEALTVVVNTIAGD